MIPDGSKLDLLYEKCVRRLPPDLGGIALRLPEVLQLAPAGVSWGDAFKHPVTLAAPAFVAEALDAPPDHIELAVTTHMLAVIHAFGVDRIEDGQVPDQPQVRRILEELRSLRDDIAASLDHNTVDEFRRADAVSRSAIRAERELLQSTRPTSEATYMSRSLSKQATGFPSSLMLCNVSATGKRVRNLVQAAISGVALSLQYRDDVLDWEDDWGHGGAWAVNIARDLNPGAEIPFGADLAVARTSVFASGALSIMLELAVEQLEQVLRAAAALRAYELAKWARAQREDVYALLVGERSSPGYAVRAHRLRFAMRGLTA